MILFLIKCLFGRYQTGTLSPLLRWLRQAAAARPPPPAVRADNQLLVPPANNANNQRPGT
jgi:hypothetical protein